MCVQFLKANGREVLISYEIDIHNRLTGVSIDPLSSRPPTLRGAASDVARYLGVRWGEVYFLMRGFLHSESISVPSRKRYHSIRPFESKVKPA